MSRLTPLRASVAVIFISAVALVGCNSGVSKNEAPGPAAQATGLTPQQARNTDQRILSDRNTFEGVQLRLRKLNEMGVPQNSYSLAKAQC